MNIAKSGKYLQNAVSGIDFKLNPENRVRTTRPDVAHRLPRDSRFLALFEDIEQILSPADSVGRKADNHDPRGVLVVTDF